MNKIEEQIWELFSDRGFIYLDSKPLIFEKLNEIIAKHDLEIITRLAETSKEVLRFKKTGIPRCQLCKKDFVKESKYVWKPDCDCLQNKNLRLSVG